MVGEVCLLSTGTSYHFVHCIVLWFKFAKYFGKSRRGKIFSAPDLWYQFSSEQLVRLTNFLIVVFSKLTGFSISVFHPIFVDLCQIFAGEFSPTDCINSPGEHGSYPNYSVPLAILFVPDRMLGPGNFHSYQGNWYVKRLVLVVFW